MKDTYFNVPASKANRLATVYTEDPSNKIIPWSHEFRNIDPDYPIMKKHYFQEAQVFHPLHLIMPSLCKCY
jgi:hypothetical protein